METHVLHLDLNTADVKPYELIDIYVKLIQSEIGTYFPVSERKHSSCPGCSSLTIKESFEKYGMKYMICDDCMTYYVMDRPEQSALNRFYRESKSREFWLKEIWTKTCVQRRKKIIEPFLEWMASYLNVNGLKKPRVLELYPNQWGLLELSKDWDWKISEPHFSNCPVADIQSMVVSFNEKNNNNDAVCLFDTIGRVNSPKLLLKSAYDFLKPGGYCFVSTFLSSGIEMMVLKGESDSILPPDRLNVLSFEGINKLINEIGFEIVEFSTPGVLDMQIIREAIEIKNSAVPQFLSYILKTRKDEELIHAFQELMQMYRLSSQARIVLKKGGGLQ